MTLVLSTCSCGFSVILSSIQQVFIKCLLCALFTIYFRACLRQLVNERVMTQMRVWPSRILSPGMRDEYEAESGWPVGHGRVQSKRAWDLIDLGSNLGSTAY